MNRILIVATSEFLSLVKTKGFIIGIMMLPVLVGASIGFQIFAQKRIDRDDHKFAVIDRTGDLYAPLAQAALEHNRKFGDGAGQTGPHFTPTPVNPGGKSIDEVKLELSDEIKADRLFAFVDIPADIIDISVTRSEPIGYYTETPSYGALPDWIESTLDKEVSARRFAKASVDPGMVAKLTRSTAVSKMGLVERNADGSVRQAKETNEIVTFVLPFGLMYLLFIAVMTTVPQLLTAVIEEKMSKISEVLVASVTPFQLMMGKLLGTATVSVLLALTYFSGGVYAIFSSGHWEFLQPHLMAWFLLFLICAVLMYGSIFIAIGAASSDMKDAQGMMQFAMLLVMMPMFITPVILRAPSSGIAVGASMFPTAAPFLMLVRLAMTPGPPLWQVLLSAVIMLASATLLVWCAGRIFRVGLLMQGKGATLPEMIRWIRA
jgi:ABC-2 type transport system permease protein